MMFRYYECQGCAARCVGVSAVDGDYMRRGYCSSECEREHQRDRLDRLGRNLADGVDAMFAEEVGERAA